MKKLFSLLAIILLLVVSNCSEIPQNNDPILGTWYHSETETLEDRSTVTIKEEWIFNDVYLGRYHRYENNEIILRSDFSWDKTDGTYLVTYLALENDPVKVVMQLEQEMQVLEHLDGVVFALRE